MSALLTATTGTGSAGGGGASVLLASNAAMPPATIAMPSTARRAIFIRFAFQDATAGRHHGNSISQTSIHG